MSLDVSLYVPGDPVRGSGIFIRDGGETRQISREEWDSKFPFYEPVVAGPALECCDEAEVFSSNITHNLTKMASDAGLYEVMWRPDEQGITKAQQLIRPLQAGLTKLEAAPEYFKQFDPPNKWGSYDGLVAFVRAYLGACQSHPEATVRVSR